MKKTRIRILIVDDDPFFAAFLKQNLIKRGFEKIEIVDTSKECLSQLNNKDIILLDYYLEKELGIDILQEIRRIDTLIPVFFISNQEYFNIALQTLKLGATEYHDKVELNFDKLVADIEHYTSQKYKNKLEAITHKITFGLI